MSKIKFFSQFVMGLRLAYRVTPLPEAGKLRFANWLAQSWPLVALMIEAERQVALETARAKLLPVASRNVQSDLGGRALVRRRNLATVHTVQRSHAGTRAVGYVPYCEVALPKDALTRLIAFYLPQFHPIPENDEAWGRGFTEWANVTRALPQVEGQVQPKLPGELGFYDLRLKQVQERQVELAKQYGIGAFCFHFYWFGGQRLLEGPLLQYLENANCDLPFCLCWANENWTRRWDGYENDVLVAQRHSEEDDLAFIAYIAKYLRDPRYVRVAGKPVLIVYRPDALPNPAKSAQRWREYCKDAGIGDIHLVSTSSFGQRDPRKFGFDAMVEFAPNNSNPTKITDYVQKLNPDFQGNVFDWRCLVERSRSYRQVPYRLYRGVNPGWDNTPRKPNSGNIFLHSSPRGYEEWLVNAVSDTVRTVSKPDERLVFVNAWNEWAEGAYLEPDTRLGYAYLAATRRALMRAAGLPSGGESNRGTTQRVCVVIHAFYPELLDEMLSPLTHWGSTLRLIVTTTAEHHAEVLDRVNRHGLKADCRVFDNRGRDILPFLCVANELADAGEELILKLHTKRSPHRVDGDTWRRDLLNKLISPKNSRDILAAFDKEPQLGMVAPEGHVLPMSFYWGSNEVNVQHLCRVMGVGEVVPTQEVFPAGSMFWVRVDALRPLLDAHLDEAAFEAERGQLDGTLPHAIERSLAVAVRGAGYFLASTASPRVPASPLAEEYGFAESSCGSAQR